MKRKYYKFTSAYCRHLKARTCFPIKFKLPEVGNYYRVPLNTELNDCIPCNGQALSENEYPALFNVIKSSNSSN